jgi:hypothetical protein
MDSTHTFVSRATENPEKITDLPHLSTDNYEEKSLSNINKANNQLSHQIIKHKKYHNI